MRKAKEGAHWFWLCSKSANGTHCNKGKKSIRTGTIFDNSQISMCNSSVNYMAFHSTVVKRYAFSRNPTKVELLEMLLGMMMKNGVWYDTKRKFRCSDYTGSFQPIS